MLRHVKVGDVLKNRADDLVTITKIAHNSDFPILYTTPNGYEYSITIEGSYYLRDITKHPLDIIDPTIYNTDSTKADSVSEIPDSPKPIIDVIKTSINGTKYTTGYLITFPNGTQLYQSDTGHIQLISQPGAPIWQQFNYNNSQE